MGKQTFWWTTLAGSLIIVLTTLAGCDSPTRLSPLANDAVILAFGDSLTYGTGAEPGQSYPAILSTLTGRKVVNAGIPGEETAQGLQRLAGVIDEHQPALLILCHGGNDILRKRKHLEIVKNLGAMIRMAQDRKIEVVLVGVPSYGLFLSTADLYKEVAKGFRIQLEGGVLSNILANNSLKSDMIHPNAQGYRVFAEAIAVFLRDRGAIR